MTNQEAIKAIQFFQDEYDSNGSGHLDKALDMAKEALKNQKIGHWIRQKGIYGLADTCECSVCGRTIYAGNENDLKDYPYCHCGAKMEGE